MAEQNEMKQVLEILTGIQGDIQGLKTDVSELKTDVSEIKIDVSELKGKVNSLEENMGAVREDVDFMRENMMTKEDGRELESRVLTHVDGLAKRSETFDHELVALRSRGERHEDRIEKLEVHVGMA